MNELSAFQMLLFQVSYCFVIYLGTCMGTILVLLARSNPFMKAKHVISDWQSRWGLFGIMFMIDCLIAFSYICAITFPAIQSGTHPLDEELWEQFEMLFLATHTAITIPIMYWYEY